jgi:hypothetical protein
LGVAVTQAGWTHKAFVYSLFALAGALALCAVYWKPLREAHPEIAPVASDVAGSSISWFTLLVVGFGIVFVLDILARIGWFKGTQTPGPSRQLVEQPKAIAQPAERVFITTSISTLTQLCEGRTSMQAAQIAKNYEDSWLRVEGDVSNVSLTFGLIFLPITVEERRIMLIFNEEWKARASQIVAGPDHQGSRENQGHRRPRLNISRL